MSLFDSDLATKDPVIPKEGRKWEVCDKIDPTVYMYGDMIYEISSGKTYCCLEDNYMMDIGNNIVTKEYKYELI